MSFSFDHFLRSPGPSSGRTHHLENLRESAAPRALSSLLLRPMLSLLRDRKDYRHELNCPKSERRAPEVARQTFGGNSGRRNAPASCAPGISKIKGNYHMNRRILAERGEIIRRRPSGLYVTIQTDPEIGLQSSCQVGSTKGCHFFVIAVFRSTQARKHVESYWRPNYSTTRKLSKARRSSGHSGA